MRVVITAMMASIAKISAEMMPFCRPMLMMISSMRPRAFMRTPMPMASRLEMPEARAAAQQATPLPTMAATSTAPARSHKYPVFRSPSRVFSPE